MELALSYLAMGFVGFCGAFCRGVTWKPATKLLQELAAIILICVGVNYLGTDVWHITETGKAFVTGGCCFAGIQKFFELVGTFVPGPLKGLFSAKS